MELNEDLIEKLWYGEIHSANKVVLGNDKEIGDVSIQLSCLRALRANAECGVRNAECGVRN